MKYLKHASKTFIGECKKVNKAPGTVLQNVIVSNHIKNFLHYSLETSFSIIYKIMLIEHAWKIET